ncbi:MAG: RsmE family RNA methyltransferase [Thermoguttaceae bacterium]
MTDRYFLDASCCEVGSRVVLSAEESHHLVRVMRGAVGTRVALFSGCGEEWIGTVAEADRRGAAVEIVITEKLPAVPVPQPRLTIITALPKGDRQKWLVEKLTELGCHKLVPLRSARSDVAADAGVVARLRRQVIEAAKQCWRCLLMEIADETRLEDCVSANSHAEDAATPLATTLRLIAHPISDAECGQRRLADFFAASTDSTNEPQTWSDVEVIIGPAGGFTSNEVETALANGWRPLDLGPTRLRTETAAIAIAARITEVACNSVVPTKLETTELPNLQ